MGIYIKNMEMPKNGELLCINIYPSGKVCIALDLWCSQIATAVPVPKHGRLIDADVLKQKIFSEPIAEDAEDPRFNLYAKVQVAGAVNKIIEAIDDAPTIIEAEEDEK